MPYSRTTWQDSPSVATAITAARLNNMEQGIVNAYIAGTGGLVNADIAVGAAIAYAKLALTGSILNADLAGSIAYAKLVLTGSIVDADISATASIAQSKLAPLVTNAQVASYTLVLADAPKIVEISNASANTLTVPPNSSVAFPIGTSITFIQTGAGQTTITPGAAVTINANPGLKLVGQWATAGLIKRATDTWVAVGNITS